MARHGREPTADADLESTYLAAVLPLHLGDEAEVMERGTGAVAGAAREGGLPLAGQPLADGVAQHDTGVGGKVRRGVEHLIRARPGVGATGDISDCVPGRLAGGDTDIAQQPQDLGDILQADEMELEVLARSDVAAPMSGVPVGDHRASVHLIGRDAPVGELDAHHVRFLLALAIDALHQTEGAELPHEPLFVPTEAAALPVEVIDLLLQGHQDTARVEIAGHGGMSPAAIRFLLLNSHRHTTCLDRTANKSTFPTE